MVGFYFSLTRVEKKAIMISYSGLRTAPKVTLPSVEMWGTNMNILRDPPKSITTRRRDKVGDTQRIVMEQDGAGSRISENIQVYARGTNPMVTVSYNNSGGTTQQASLPYKIQTLRPPILSAYDLLPLSRLPRRPIHDITARICRPDLIQLSSCPETRRSIITTPLNTSATHLRTFVSGKKDTSTEQSRTTVMKPTPELRGVIPSRRRMNATEKNPFTSESFRVKTASTHHTSYDIPKSAVQDDRASNDRFSRDRRDISERPRRLDVSDIHPTHRRPHHEIATNTPYTFQGETRAKDVFTQKTYGRKDGLSTDERMRELPSRLPRTEVSTQFRSGGVQTKHSRPEIVHLRPKQANPVTNVATQRRPQREALDVHMSTKVSLDPRRDRGQYGGYSIPAMGQYDQEAAVGYRTMTQPATTDRSRVGYVSATTSRQI